MTEIPKFKINQIQIHEIPIWKFNNPVVNYINKPVVDIPGCVRVHRNNLTCPKCSSYVEIYKRRDAFD